MTGRAILKFYQQTLNRRPYMVQAVQTGLLMGAGDIIAQTAIEKRQKLDYERTLKFASIGFFYVGPVLRVWYGLLNKYIGAGGKSVGIKKVFCDQVLFAPVLLGTLLVMIPATQGKSLELIKRDLNANYLDVITTNYCVWPWVQLVNFSYVPLQYQVLVAQIVALFWNTYLAWKTNSNTGTVTKNPQNQLPVKKIKDCPVQN